MSDKINPSIAKAVSDVIEEKKSKGFQYRCNHCGNEYPINSHGPSVCADCGEKMNIHSLGDEEEKPAIVGADDVLISLGDLSDAKIEDVTAGKNFETIALDYIATFNGAVTQGVSPLKALMAMFQASAIVCGMCLRAGMRPNIAYGFVAQIIKKIRQSTREVQIVTKQ